MKSICGMISFLLVLVAAASEWQYTFEKPSEQWMAPAFVATGWKKGDAPFGTPGTPNVRVKTVWNTRDIWLRQTCAIADVSQVQGIRMIHDEDVVVYINGVQACKSDAFITHYQEFPISAAARATLHAGDNLLAVHCLQRGGAQGVDVELIIEDSNETVLRKLEVEDELLADYQRQKTMPNPARRAERLKNMPQKWVFARHAIMGGSHYAYTEALSDAQAERNFLSGGELCMLEAVPEGLWKETVLLETKEGVIRDVDVNFAATKILFSWKKSDRGDDYHLYEMDVATRAIRPLTFGEGVADYEGCYLPDGEIIFNSTRCMQIVDCWWTEVSNLYRCDAEGKNIRRLTRDQVHLNYPAISWDGRILYTRWEYNDRSQMYPQPLFQMWPDGTSQTAVYGENSWFPTTIIHARAIPNSRHIFAIATGHHTRQVGELILIEPEKGRQEAEGVTCIAPVRETKSVIIDQYGQDKDLFAYPYPLDENSCVVTYSPLGWNKRVTKGENRKKWFGLYWMDRDGNRELLASRLKLPPGRAVPLVARQRPPERPKSINLDQTTGTFYIQDVYIGEPMQNVPRGTVKTLRVVSLDYRSAGIGNNSNGGPGGGALVSTPVAIGNGAWDPKIVIGDAEVYADGSVFFSTEARIPLYFMLLDAKGRMVQTMRSWTTLQPGENASCVGCHELKNSVPLASAKGNTLALKKGVQELKGARRAFSYLAQIQPILDKHCIQCHKADHPSLNLLATPVLDAGAKRTWVQSYLSLTHAKPDLNKDGEKLRWRGNADHAVLNWISAGSTVKLIPPYFKGSNTSTLFAKLDKGHCKTLSADELATLALWVDLGVPFCKDYADAAAWTPEEWAKYKHFLEKRAKWATP